MSECKMESSLSGRVFRCEVCGLEIDRDWNAALNIRAEMERLLSDVEPDPGLQGGYACGEDMRPREGASLIDADLREAGITHQIGVSRLGVRSE